MMAIGIVLGIVIGVLAGLGGPNGWRSCCR